MSKLLLVYNDGRVESMDSGYILANFIVSIGGHGLVTVINPDEGTYFKHLDTWLNIPNFLDGSILIPVNSPLMKRISPDDLVRIS